MPNAVFTTKVSPVYDDLPERRYHFPKTYLRQVAAAEGNMIVYYEPRREGADLRGTKGRQVYFATARLDRIESDPVRADHYYALVSEYLEFPQPVPFQIEGSYFESSLCKLDGSTNKGAFGRSVRTMEAHEFQAICSAGFLDAGTPSATLRLEEPSPLLRESLQTVIGSRPFRDRAFSRVIQANYGGVCSFTGLRILGADGQCETESAHIRPITEMGPDSPRNGIALSRTVHWMFDAGILSVEDSGAILMVDRLVPKKIRSVLNANGIARLPSDWTRRPHPEFLRYHREVVYKGN